MSEESQSTLVADDLIPYVDDERDFRDIVLLDAIKAAIQLLDNDDVNSRIRAASVLRLARDRLEGCWPHVPVKFTGVQRKAS